MSEERSRQTPDGCKIPQNREFDKPEVDRIVILHAFGEIPLMRFRRVRNPNMATIRVSIKRPRLDAPVNARSLLAGIRIVDSILQSSKVNFPGRRDHAIVRQMTPQRVDCLRPPSNKKVPSSKRHTRGLLHSALYSGKAHCRTRSGFRNPTGIIRIVLLALDVGPHLNWQYRLNFKAKRAALAIPVMRTCASLHRNGTTRNGVPERQQPRPPDLPVENRLAVGCHTENLKHILGQIDPNNANLFCGRLLLNLVITPPVWHIDAVGGAAIPSDTYERLPRTCQNS